MELSLKNHPAQARDARTNAPLFDQHGVPVPLFPDQRAIYVDGILAGYCTAKPGRPISLITHRSHEELDAITQYITEVIGKPSGISQPPLHVAADLEQEQDDEDDDE